MTTSMAVKVAGFVILMAGLTTVFVIDDLTVVGALLNVVEFPAMMLLGAGYATVAFTSKSKK